MRVHKYSVALLFSLSWGHLAVFGDIFGCYNCAEIGDLPVARRGKVRDAIKHPTLQRIVPSRRRYPAQISVRLRLRDLDPVETNKIDQI